LRIIEEFLQGKTGNEADGEDRIIITDNYVAVVDGATNKSSRDFGTLTPGQLAAQLIADTLQELPGGLPQAAVLEKLSQAIESFYRAEGLLERLREAPHERATATAAILSLSLSEVWIIGDCQCLIDGRLYKNEKQIDSVLASTRALVLELELNEGVEVNELAQADPGREFIRPLLIRQSRLQNARGDLPLAYSAIDGFPVTLERTQVISTKGAREIVLASDGYPELRSTLADSERHLRAVLREDPLLIRLHQSTKGVTAGNISFDDRAYLRLASS
jgi:glycerophosphoryl diester phosphodiesterase